MTTERNDVHQTITDQIVAAIEAGPGEFRCPWHRAGAAIMRPRNVATGNSYQGVNILALWAAGDARGYQSGTWGTYRQWQGQGVQVQKGERGSTIVFYKSISGAGDKDEKVAEDGDRGAARFVARASTVFAVEQTDAYTPVFMDDRPSQFEICDKAEAFFKATGAVIKHRGSRAFYSLASDEITLPPRSAFKGTPTSTNVESYYSILAHEAGHWTGAKSRLDRSFGKRFGDDAYAVEELTAELTAAFLCSELEVSLDPRPDHAQYLAHWLRIMKADGRALFAAASKASQAVRYLEELQPG